MVLIPGVIDTVTNYVEHPEVVAERLERAVAAVGDKERVIAGTDCGFSTLAGDAFVAEDVVWAKLATLRHVMVSPRTKAPSTMAQTGMV